MPSLIPGYEYDIFISYRQKDNKGEKWVSEFVEALKTELDSTFKEDVSVYFDVNPHDGLLETYDINASLAGKLKCLVFIPIISRTYCDQKSFAWVHEFKAFVEQAHKDPFGLKVTLPDGNVSNRVLPVRIHDLDVDDISLCESVMDGPLRGIEFIYKELGVNRSLLPEDHEEKNLNRTNYRNQINKVSLAIKQIISGLKVLNSITPDKNSELKKPGLTGKSEQVTKGQKRVIKLRGQKLFTAVLITAIIIMSVLYFYPKIFSHDKFKELKNNEGKISIAVMPFDNLTGDTTLNWFERGISSLIINGLGNSSALSVVDEYTMFDVFESMGKINKRGISGSVAKEVARKAKAESYIAGSFQGKNNLYWILVNLVNTRTGDILWTNKIEGDLKSAGYLDIANKLCGEVKNCLEIKALTENTDYDFRETYPRSSEAYKYFIEGMNDMMNRYFKASIISFSKALEIDSTFTFASFFLAWTYSTTLQDKEAREWILKAYRNKDRLPLKYQPWLEQWHAFYISKNLSDILRYTNMLEGSGIESRWLWYDIGATYNFVQQYEKSINAFEKVMTISHERGGYWKHMTFYLQYSKALHNTGRHKEEKEIYRTYQSLFPDNKEILGNITTCFLTTGDTTKANESIIKIKSFYNKGLTELRNLDMALGTIYRDAKIFTKAEKYFRKAYEADLLANDSIQKPYIESGYNLAQVTIENGSNLKTGMDIVNKNLETDPENSLFLGLKGWGLFKQGNYSEALRYLKMSDQKSLYLDFEVNQHIQEVEKAIADQKHR